MTQKPTRQVTTMGDLYLIRHAQASFGKPDYDELSELGFSRPGCWRIFLNGRAGRLTPCIAAR